MKESIAKLFLSLMSVFFMLFLIYLYKNNIKNEEKVLKLVSIVEEEKTKPITQALNTPVQKLDLQLSKTSSFASQRLALDIPYFNKSSFLPKTSKFKIQENDFNKSLSFSNLKVYDSKNFGLKTKLIKRVNPIYPYNAQRRNIEGKVFLSFVVDLNGKVSDVTVLKSTPEDLFNEAAIVAVKQWLFEPVQLKGKKIYVKMYQELEFRLD